MIIITFREPSVWGKGAVRHEGVEGPVDRLVKQGWLAVIGAVETIAKISSQAGY